MQTDVLTRLAGSLAERYEVQRELGAGGMATVYRAIDQAFFSAKGDKLYYRVGSGVMQVPLTVTGDRMTLGRPTMYVEFAFADFLGRAYKLGHDDRLLVKLLPRTAPQSEIRVMTGSRIP